MVASHWTDFRFAEVAGSHDDVIDRARERFSTVCTRGAWNLEQRRCVVFAVKGWELSQCFSRLPDADRRAVEEIELAALSEIRDQLR